MKINNETGMTTNGNVSSARETVNNNVSKYSFLGNAKRNSWNGKRSYRSI